MMRSGPPPRRPLSQLGGEITTRGDAELARPLVAALEASEQAEADDLTHGFHTYPARMHPAIARALIDHFTRREDIVLDPFAGSGTVLVEALVATCRAQGVDLSPLASRVAEVHCALRDGPDRARFAATVRAVAAESEARVRARAATVVPIDRSERAYYQPHVMLELSGLWQEIQQVPTESDRRALEMVFSSLLVKFSRQRADTSEEQIEKRLRKGLVTEFFARKGSELVERWEALYDTANELYPAHPARFVTGDARRLPQLLGRSFQADLVLSSPPYGGTYDYAQQHARRTAWLQLDMHPLRAAEIGARRNASPERGGQLRWNRELADVLGSIRTVLAPSGRVILWIGDAEQEGARTRADEQVHALAPDASLELVASASQDRRDPRGGPTKHEHLLLLEPVRRRR